MSFFSFDEGNTSYKYPIIKIIVSIVLILVLIHRNDIIPITIHIDFNSEVVKEVITEVITLLIVAIVFVCIHCIYMSIGELSVVKENRAKGKILSGDIIVKSKQYTVDEIVCMAETNDIIEIQIVSKNRAVKIGSSSDCKNGSSKFFDKLYYIDGVMYKNIKDFESELLSYAINGRISVLFIDGISPK